MTAIDTNSHLYTKALEIAVGTFLAQYPETMTPEQVMEHLASDPEHWPSDIVAWQPFEFDIPETVYGHIENLAESIYTAFASNAYINRPAPSRCAEPA